MLTAADVLPSHKEPPDDRLRRSYADSGLELGEVILRGKKQRTVTGLVVPYDTPTDILEMRDGCVIAYKEQFARGALYGAEKAPDRVKLQIEHDERLERLAGYGFSFRESAEGCIGTFVLYPSMADRAIELMETSHRGLSVTFQTISPSFGSEREGALVTREQVRLRAVAAVSDPAYADARIVALRAQAESAAEAQREADRQVAEMAAMLRFLRDEGQELGPEQLRWIEQHGIDLDRISS